VVASSNVSSHMQLDGTRVSIMSRTGSLRQVLVCRPLTGEIRRQRKTIVVLGGKQSAF